MVQLHRHATLREKRSPAANSNSNLCPSGRIADQVPFSGYVILVTLMVAVTLLLLSPGVVVLRFLFPLMAGVAAALLFTKSKPLYITLVCWLWFLSPLVRRLIEFRSPTDATIALLAPYLACLIPLPVLLFHWQCLLIRRFVPLTVMLAAILYGTLVGLTNFKPASVAQALIIWIAPLSVACFLNYYANEAQAMYRSFEHAMVAGTAVVGIYGIYQYFYAPPWDCLWMRILANPTFGFPMPLEIRVFSTMNGPQVLAIFLATGILLGIRSRSLLRFVAVPAGLASLTLSMARTAWIGFFLGVVYLIVQMTLRERLRTILPLVGAGAVFLVVLQNPQANNAISRRISSLSDGGRDESMAVRVNGHMALLSSMAKFPFGLGLGAQQTGSDRGPANDEITGHGGQFVMENDSTLAAFLVSLGCTGAVLGTASLAAAGVVVFRMKPDGITDTVSLKMVLVVILGEFLLNDVINGPAAFLTWACIGFSLAHLNRSSSPDGARSFLTMRDGGNMVAST